MDQKLNRYSYALPRKVRERILHTLNQHNNGFYGGSRFEFKMMLHEVENLCLAKCGAIRDLSYGDASDIPIIGYFLTCAIQEATEFIEMCFQTRAMGGATEGAQRAIAAINRIFEEEGLGYELTPPQLVDTGEPGLLFGRPTGRNGYREELPRLVKKGDRDVHEQVVKPALELLRDSRLATANSELLTAFEKVRHGQYADAITSCGAAFESVLRTICDVKKWPYDANRATCATLVEVCRDNGLFPAFYAEVFKAVGTVRNKLGDAHGKGSKPAPAATRAHAEHMIAMTCTNITFLVGEAGF